MPVPSLQSGASIGAGVPSIMSGLSLTTSATPQADLHAFLTQPVAHASAPAPAGAVLTVGGGGEYSSIQDAVNHAHDGDTIEIASGYYYEQVTMDGLSNVTIEGAPGADVHIVAPGGTLTQNGSGVSALLAIENGANDFVRNITINGDGDGGAAPGSNFVGLYYQDASGGATDVNVYGVRSGGEGGITGAQGTGYGVYVDNDASGARLDFTMNGGAIEDFQKGGMYIIHANANISNVYIQGAGSTDVNAQNGAVLSDDTGTFHNNQIYDMGFQLDSATASGVLVEDCSNFTVTGNVIEGSFANEDELRNFVGVYVSNESGGGDIVTNNTISNVNEAIVADGFFNLLNIANNQVSNITEYDPGETGFGVDVAPDPFSTADFLIRGSDGNDTISGASGDDTLSGGALGDDSLAGGRGDDTYIVTSATVHITEAFGQGTDTVESSLSYTLGANLEDLVLIGSGDTTGTGNGADNMITGNGGDNTLDGGGGDDTLAGGAGDDTYLVSDLNSHIVENAGDGTDTVDSTISYTLDANVENLVLTGAGALDGLGNDEDNTLTGNDSANRLSGALGDDTVIGGGGVDSLFGAAGDDTLVSRGDGDLMNGGPGVDTFSFTDLERGKSAHIVGFEAGETIDLSAIAGDFAQVDAFTGHADQYTVTYKVNHDQTLIKFDTDGDGTFDHKIVINGDFSHAGDIHFVA